MTSVHARGIPLRGSRCVTLTGPGAAPWGYSKVWFPAEVPREIGNPDAAGGACLREHKRREGVAPGRIVRATGAALCDACGIAYLKRRGQDIEDNTTGRESRKSQM